MALIRVSLSRSVGYDKQRVSGILRNGVGEQLSLIWGMDIRSEYAYKNGDGARRVDVL